MVGHGTLAHGSRPPPDHHAHQASSLKVEQTFVVLLPKGEQSSRRGNRYGWLSLCNPRSGFQPTGCNGRLIHWKNDFDRHKTPVCCRCCQLRNVLSTAVIPATATRPCMNVFALNGSCVPEDQVSKHAVATSDGAHPQAAAVGTSGRELGTGMPTVASPCV
jgi:hypothetical protein